jgi:hypothetical protein
MTGRPCRPSADLKGIWQFLLPDTAFPACGTAEEAGPEMAPARDDDRPNGEAGSALGETRKRWRSSRR